MPNVMTNQAHAVVLPYVLAQTPVGNQNTAITSLAATLGSAPVTGDLVVVCFGFTVSNNAATCASTGATWTREVQSTAASSSRSMIFWSTTVTTATITVSWTGSGQAAMDVLHFTGGPAASPPDVSATAQVSGTTLDLGALTLADAGELVVTHTINNKLSNTAPSGYTALAARLTSTPTNGQTAYLLSSGASEHPIWTLSASGGSGAGTVVAFRHA